MHCRRVTGECTKRCLFYVINYWQLFDHGMLHCFMIHCFFMILSDACVLGTSIYGWNSHIFNRWNSLTHGSILQPQPADIINAAESEAT
jgi:hypothetical protein